MKTLTAIIVVFCALNTLCAKQYYPLMVDEDGKLPNGSSVGGGAVIKDAQLIIDLSDAEKIWTDFEVKVMSRTHQVCVYFFSTHRAGLASFAASHPGITDNNAKVYFNYSSGSEDGRNMNEYPYKTAGESITCLGVYFNSWFGESSHIQLCGIIFKPDFTQAWVRAAFLDPDNYVIVWRSNPVEAEVDYYGGKIWRPVPLTLIYEQ